MGTLEDLVCGGRREDFAMTAGSVLSAKFFTKSRRDWINFIHSESSTAILNPYNIIVSFPKDTDKSMVKLVDFGIRHASRDEATELRSSVWSGPKDGCVLLPHKTQLNNCLTPLVSAAFVGLLMR